MPWRAGPTLECPSGFGANSCAWSAGGTHLAVGQAGGGNTGMLSWWDVSGRMPTLVASTALDWPSGTISIEPDGRVAFAGREGVGHWDPRTDARTELPLGQGFHGSAAGTGGTLAWKFKEVLLLRDGEEQWRVKPLSSLPERVTGAQLLGDKVVVSGTDQQVHVLDRATGQLRHRLHGDPQRAHGSMTAPSPCPIPKPSARAIRTRSRAGSFSGCRRRWR